jgi:hemerythrin-like domain-containing protein
MTYATQQLRDEHEGIKVAIAVLDRLAGDLEAGRAVEVDDLDNLVDFIKTFADRCHHGKEEDLLFPALEKVGIPKEGGPIGVMLAEHTHGREFARAMSDALPGLREGDASARQAFASAAHGYARLLTEHIEKENNILFCMAEQHLAQEAHAALSEGFERVEQERIGPGVHERYHALLDRLQEKYLTPVA